MAHHPEGMESDSPWVAAQRLPTVPINNTNSTPEGSQQTWTKKHILIQRSPTLVLARSATSPGEKNPGVGQIRSHGRNHHSCQSWPRPAQGRIGGKTMCEGACLAFNHGLDRRRVGRGRQGCGLMRAIQGFSPREFGRGLRRVVSVLRPDLDLETLYF
jgi:hypothetical protein